MLAMPPERREQMLERLPQQQQARLRQALENFDKLPPEQRRRQLGILNMYANLPPERQVALARQIQIFNHLPDDRIAALRPELVKLHRMPESERSERMASEEFKSRFTPAEQQMLAEISPYFPFSGR
jgi:transposase